MSISLQCFGKSDGCVFMKGIMLVYDITEEKSFDNITKWLRDIEMVCI